jgi:hypothetical protein
MKKIFLFLLIAIFSMQFLTGCLNLSLGGGSKSESQNPTIGQQLIDLQKARKAGAITESEYEAERAKLLGNR